MEEAEMRAQVGDRIILAAEHIDQPTRDGEVLEVRGRDGGPPYVVRWSDGHTGLIYPGPGAVLSIGGHGEEPLTGEIGHEPARSRAPVPTGVPTTVTTHHPQHGHIREWQVRVSILESGDDTSASVVLLADSPDQLSARGTSHRSSDDVPARRIGDEVAVARALRHLADRLIETAEHDIEARTGEEAHVKAT
jgi:hypothetical protein